MENPNRSAPTEKRGVGRPRSPSAIDSRSLIQFWLDSTALPELGMTNDAIAGNLGYARPHIVSMWRMGKAKVPMHNVPALAELFCVDLEFLHYLCFEQSIGDDTRLSPINDLLFDALGEGNQLLVEELRRQMVQ